MANERYCTMMKLLSAATQLSSTFLYQEVELPGPHDDAEAQLHEEVLLDTAREYVKAHKGMMTIQEEVAAGMHGPGMTKPEM